MPHWEGKTSTGRDSGKTTRAMIAAPRNAVYVWVNHRLDYPRELARRLNRGDLTIVGPDWLRMEKVAGRDTAVVRDHAADLTEPQWNAYHYANDRYKRINNT